MKKSLHFIFLFFLTNLFFCRVSSENPGFTKVWNLNTSWIVSPLQAIDLSNQGGIWIDARGSEILGSFLNKDIIRISWEEFSSDLPSMGGNLKHRDSILQILRDKKIDIQKPLLIMGGANKGWGEEGRIIWMLRSIGIQNSFLVDGGIESVRKAILNLKKPERKELISEGNESNQIDSVTSLELVSLKGSNNYILIDTREKREYDGETPYGEMRGGHIPNAKWLYYKEFLDSDGFVLSKEEIEKKLSLIGYQNNQTIISYCSGGVRSAFVTAILRSYGFQAKNYPGSMWEYTSLRSEDGFILE